MPNNSSSQPFPQLQRIAQKNSFYCGPATLQMLLGFQGVEIDQETIVMSLQIGERIKIHGMTISEMGNFVKQFYPQFQFWYKFEATIPDLSLLVNNFLIPVGVEWQGVFDYPDEEAAEDEDDDPGHIAVITAVNTAENYIMIADPDLHYAGADRRFSILQFERRWWDINEMVDPRTKKRQEVDDFHGLFVITRNTDNYPERLNLKRI